MYCWGGHHGTLKYEQQNPPFPIHLNHITICASTYRENDDKAGTQA